MPYVSNQQLVHYYLSIDFFEKKYFSCDDLCMELYRDKTNLERSCRRMRNVCGILVGVIIVMSCFMLQDMMQDREPIKQRTPKLGFFPAHFSTCAGGPLSWYWTIY